MHLPLQPGMPARQTTMKGPSPNLPEGPLLQKCKIRHELLPRLLPRFFRGLFARFWEPGWRQNPSLSMDPFTTSRFPRCHFINSEPFKTSNEYMQESQNSGALTLQKSNLVRTLCGPRGGTTAYLSGPCGCTTACFAIDDVVKNCCLLRKG